MPGNAEVSKALQPHMKALGKQAKRAMPFVQLARERFAANGVRTLEAQLEVDEEAVLTANYEYLTANLGLDADGLEVSCFDASTQFQCFFCFTFSAFFTTSSI